jgi:MFS family permease
VQNAYTLAFARLLLLGGRLGDLVGRRRTLVAGMVVFTAASLLCGIAPNGVALIAARALQGVGAAAIAPSTLALLTVNFAAGEARNRALSAYSGLLGLGASLGFVLGGVLTALASWLWVFLVNLPVGVAAAVLAPRVIADAPLAPGRLDLGGTATSTLGMVALVLGLVRVASDGWGDAQALLAFAAAVQLLAAFVVLQGRVAAPIVPPRLLADPLRALDHGT